MSAHRRQQPPSRWTALRLRLRRILDQLRGPEGMFADDPDRDDPEVLEARFHTPRFAFALHGDRVIPTYHNPCWCTCRACHNNRHCGSYACRRKP